MIVDGGADLTIVVPLWRRTKNLPRLVESVALTVPEAELLFVASRDDVAVWECLLDHQVPSEPMDHVRGWATFVDWPGGSQGDYARKINAGYRATERPFIFTGADDIVFRDGWYEKARALISETAHGVGVVGTVDGLNGRTIEGEHSTHTLVARWYADVGGCADEDHVIYHEGYHHEYVDDELCQTAMFRGAYAHSFDSLVEHVHWHTDEKLDDETYMRGRAHSRLSRRLYLYRRRMWGRA